jgi:hypothetical protein
MLRINLLPTYVAQRRLSKRLVAGFAALFVILALAFTGWELSINRALTTETQLATAATQGQQVTQGIQTQATNELALVGPITQKVDFVKQVHIHNLNQVLLYYRLVRYTYPKVTYTDATYSGSTMTIKAYTPSFPILMDYLTRIRKDPDFTAVTISNVPDSTNAYVDKYYLGHTLVSVGNAPGTQTGGIGSYPGAGSLGGSSGSGGYPGSVPGNSSTGPGGAQMPQYGQSLLDTELADAEKTTSLEQLITSKMNPLATPSQEAEYALQLAESIRMKRVPSGFFFTVTATLANPQLLTPVAAPGSSGGATTTGGPMGMPGAPPAGMSPGAPPAGMSPGAPPA